MTEDSITLIKVREYCFDRALSYVQTLGDTSVIAVIKLAKELEKQILNGISIELK